jgi:hypothetical protein
MKKLLLFTSLILIGCGEQEKYETGVNNDCKCGTVVYKAISPEGGVILRVKNDCDQQITEIRFTQNVPYNLNQKYCYGI